MGAFELLIAAFARAEARFVVIGLSGANYYAGSGAGLFLTQDRDLFLSPDVDNVLATWRVCEAVGLDLFCGREPLDRPRDRVLAERIVANEALVHATDDAGLHVDFTLFMAGFDFESVWRERRIFKVDDVEVPVARLAHIVESKRKAGREKDRLFFATHAEAIRDLIELERRDESAASPVVAVPSGRKGRGRSPGKRGGRR